MANQPNQPVFNPRAQMVTPERYAVDSVVLMLQWLIVQAARSTPQTGLFATVPANPFLGQPFVFEDSTTATWGATIAGGGAFTVLGVWLGTNWTVMGKA